LNARAPAHRIDGILLASAGAIAFSGKAIIVKLAYRYGVDAVTLIMYRMLFALPLFLAMAWWAGRDQEPLSGAAGPLTGADLRLLTGLGFSGYYLASFLDFSGLQYISANLERLILYLNPTIVLAIGALKFHTPVTAKQCIALLVSYLGVCVVFGHDVTVVGPHVALGSALVLASAVSYALYLVYSGQALKRLGALRITGVASTIACVLCIAQFFILRPPSAAFVAPQVIWLSVLNGTLCTVLPVMLVMVAIQRVGASVAAQAGIIGPLSTIFLSVLILGEPFTPWLAAGTVLVLFGIWLLARWK
jgi:drug/metabolite transporter (DMT)-like permease